MTRRDPSPVLRSAARAVAGAVRGAGPPGADGLEDLVAGALVPAPSLELGHFALPCFVLARPLRRPPAAIAGDLAAALSGPGREAGDPDGALARVRADGPYLNLSLRPALYGRLVVDPAIDGSLFQGPFAEPGPATMIEYSQPNTHKALHVGHMRNLCLGDALVRAARYAGTDVVSATYPGDAGAHVAKCLWRLERTGERPGPGEDKGAWLGRAYAEAERELEGLGGTPGEEGARAELARIQREVRDGKGPSHDLWLETREWSLEQMRRAYDWAGVAFDHWFFESEMDAPSLELARGLVRRGVLKEDAGAVGADLKEDGLGFCVLVKSDGTGLYAAKDVLLATRKFRDFGVGRSVYVVDRRQELHFRQVFRILERMGFEEARECRHLGYDVVELPDGPMSSRKGNVVPLMELVRALEDKVRRDHLDRYAGDWTEEDIRATAADVAAGAVKYGMVSVDVGRKIVFDMDAWTRLDGDTGPYLQYVHARVASLLRRAGFDPSAAADPGLLVEDEEAALMVALSLFNSVVVRAADRMRPSLIASHLFDLGRAFNNFYAACPVLRAGSPALAAARLRLAAAAGAVMREGLGVLGIRAPERM